MALKVKFKMTIGITSQHQQGRLMKHEGIDFVNVEQRKPLIENFQRIHLKGKP